MQLRAAHVRAMHRNGRARRRHLARWPARARRLSARAEERERPVRVPDASAGEVGVQRCVLGAALADDNSGDRGLCGERHALEAQRLSRRSVTRAVAGSGARPAGRGATGLAAEWLVAGRRTQSFR